MPQFPRELVALVRSIVILEGVIAKIDPDLEIMECIYPYVKERNKEEMLKSLTSISFQLKGIQVCF